MKGLETTQHHVSEVPALSSLYLKGARSTARHRTPWLGAIGRSEVLPHDYVVATTVTPSAADVVAYQHFFGMPAGGSLSAAYLHVVAFPLTLLAMTHPKFPLPLLGMVHTSNQIDFRRAPEVGEALDVSAWSENLRPHRKGTEVDVCAEIYSGSELLWSATSTYLAKGKKLGIAVDVISEANDLGARPLFRPPLPTEVWELPADIGRRYASISGDVNPIHMSALSARALGFQGAIAHGMYAATRALASVSHRLPDSFRWSVKFAAPVLIPGRVLVRTTVGAAVEKSRSKVDISSSLSGSDLGPDTARDSVSDLNSATQTKGSTTRDAAADDVTHVAWNERSSRVHFTSSISALE